VPQCLTVPNERKTKNDADTEIYLLEKGDRCQTNQF